MVSDSHAKCVSDRGLRWRNIAHSNPNAQRRRKCSPRYFANGFTIPKNVLAFTRDPLLFHLETILTRIPAVCEEAWNPGNLHIPAAIPFYLFELNPRHIPEDRTCPRTLNGEHGNIIRNIGNGHIASRLILEKPSPVLVTVTRVVNDKVSNAADSEDGEIVHNSTLRIAEERILAPSDGEL